MIKQALMATAIVFAATAAHAAPGEPVTLLSEGFDNDYSTLAGKGWVITNASSPIGSITEGWFQGGTTFSGQAGGLGSYIASNYLVASEAPGSTIASYLISPSFSTAAKGTVSFYARADILAGYSDAIRFGLSTTGSSSLGAFSFGPTITLTGAWTEYTVSFAGNGNSSNARFAIEYLGSAATANYIGVDTVAVTAVPEPSTYLLMGAGLLGLALRRRATSASKAA